MNDDTKVFGFWIYLMTDLIIFAVLFSAYAVLRDSTFGGPSSQELFHIPSALAETLILLTSSFTCSLATLCIYRGKKNQTIFWFLVTLVLGISFLVIEISEFSNFINKGSGPQRSAFLSSFFALVCTHGLHVFIGVLWMVVAIIHIGFYEFSTATISRSLRLALFWHFLDVVWIFIFTVVYGMGHLL